MATIKYLGDVNRTVPFVNDRGLTLVIFKHALLDAGRGEIVRVDSVDELYEAFGTAHGSSGTVSVEEFAELYSAEYLLKSGVSLLCYSILSDAGTLAAGDITNIEDQQEYDYKMVVIPYDFVSYDSDTTTTTFPELLVEMVATNSDINAQLFLDLDPDTSSGDVSTIKGDISDFPSSKVELFINSGFTEATSKFAVPATVSLTEYSEGVDFYGIPASLAAVARKASALMSKIPWEPVAGEQNGLVPEFISLYSRIFTADKEAFQLENVNVLLNRKGVGNLFVSQNTMGDDSDSSNPLIRSHIVTQALYVKRRLQKIADSFHSQPNNRASWDSISLSIKAMFSRMVDMGGVDSYNVQVGLGTTMTEDDIADGLLIVNISYLPVRVIEDITFNIIIKERAGISQLNTTGGDL
jgi:hypothetical protein